MKFNCATFDVNSRKRYTYSHLKRDGHFTNVIRNLTGQVSIWTSFPKDITADLTWHPDYDKWQSLPKQTSLLGELWLPGKRAEAIRTAINEHDVNLRFDVFAMRVSGDISSNELAAHPLEEIAATVAKYGLVFLPFTRLPNESHKLNNAEYAAYIGKLLDYTVSHNVDSEGLVLKNANLSDWCKVKRRRTVDLIITGFNPGSGKFANQIGSIVCRTTEGFIIADVSGMTDVQRQWMTERSGELIGKVIEVEYQNVGAQGRLRHPSFVQFRDDKHDNECLITQDAALAEFWGARESLFKDLP